MSTLVFKGQRPLEGWPHMLVRIYGIVIISYHLYAAQFGAPEVLKFRSTHLSMYVAMVFLTFGITKKVFGSKIPWYDYLCAVLAWLPTLYLFLDYERLTTRFPYVSALTNLDWIMGILAIILTVEACRRSLGPALPIIWLFFTLHALFGPYFPSLFRQSAIIPRRLMDHLFLTTQGLYGTVTGISATLVLMFVLLGAILEAAKGGQLFMDIASASMGKSRGGPAKAAIIASGLFGSISGSHVANVYATGTFTIPLMKKIGFKPVFAGAVEAVASTSGQLVPPIMGTAAFLMADFLKIPYITVAKAAILPAVLYLFAAFMMVHFEALKNSLPSMSEELVKQAKKNILPAIHLVISIGIVVYLLSRRHTPFFAAYYGVVAAFILAQLRSHTRMNIKTILDSLEKAARRLTPIAAALFVASLIVGTIELSGLGLRITSIILQLSGENLLITLFLIMGTCIVLGMGLPTTAAYLIVAIFGAPALIELGVVPLAAHFFVFYYAIISGITPPVAITAYAAATVAETPMQKTAIRAVQLGAAIYIVPFIMVYNPELVLVGTGGLEYIQVMITAILGVIPFTVAVQSFLLRKTLIIERVLALVSGLLLFVPGTFTDAIGIIILALLFAYQKYGVRSAQVKPELS